jgi:hypothetical protein
MEAINSFENTSVSVFQLKYNQLKFSLGGLSLNCITEKYDILRQWARRLTVNPRKGSGDA